MSFQWPLALLSRRRVGHLPRQTAHRAKTPEAAADAAEQRRRSVA